MAGQSNLDREVGLIAGKKDCLAEARLFPTETEKLLD